MHVGYNRFSAYPSSYGQSTRKQQAPVLPPTPQVMFTGSDEQAKGGLRRRSLLRGALAVVGVGAVGAGVAGCNDRGDDPSKYMNTPQEAAVYIERDLKERLSNLMGNRGKKFEIGAIAFHEQPDSLDKSQKPKDRKSNKYDFVVTYREAGGGKWMLRDGSLNWSDNTSVMVGGTEYTTTHANFGNVPAKWGFKSIDSIDRLSAGVDQGTGAIVIYAADTRLDKEEVYTRVPRGVYRAYTNPMNRTGNLDPYTHHN